ncbi:hypothetical protein NKR23_g12454 [Pleurostoma richardsiae]|uniref:Zn(2)-C6 fungal-type domain-containing protein n=1 Tax=Pleurostoma richardsiae TaxID=41990 RepID=A0AA38VAV6_9PEZI|nr:hypothetical protein NKR23_g12454 [Pleurostoma richardsiae]
MPASHDRAHMGGQSVFRPLLPAPASSKSAYAAPAPGLNLVLSKRPRASAACEPCRKKKVKCDGRRPICGHCRRRGYECDYRTDPTETHGAAHRRKSIQLERKCDMYEELLGVLRTGEETEVMELLRRIRAGHSVEHIIAAIREGRLLLQLSDDTGQH